MSGLEFVGYALLAVAIAVILSSVELLTKHQSRSLREIFASGYYVGFALLNAFFCFLVYWTLPWLSGALFNAQLPIDVDTGLGRALAAALGYLVVARLSILDITTKTGETYGAGFDAIYNGVAQYLLRHHNRRLRRAMRADFFTLYDEVGFPAFLAAAERPPSPARPGNAPRRRSGRPPRRRLGRLGRSAVVPPGLRRPR